MPKLSIKLAAALAFAGVSVGEYSAAVAQLPAAGEVTISDNSEPITEAEQLPTPGDAPSSSGTATPESMAYAEGYAGGIPSGYDPSGMSYGGVTFRDGDWYGFQNAGPYWLRPVKRPIYRVPVQYARYWPTSYYTGGYDPALRYGQPLPMVYQPTDTTQLGFYHQRVPQWQPRPNAIPGPPWPPHWHYVVPVRYGVYNGPGGDAYGYQGGVIDGNTFDSSYGTYSPSTEATNPPAVINPEQSGSNPMPTIPAEVPPPAPAPK